MSVRRPKFEEEESAQTINISPLIDVIFILLLFFIVTSTFSEIRVFGVDVPSATNAESSEDAPLEIVISQTGEILMGGEETTLDEIEAFASANTGGKVLICADTKSSAGRLVEVMDTLKGAGITDVYIAAKQ